MHADHTWLKHTRLRCAAVPYKQPPTAAAQHCQGDSQTSSESIRTLLTDTLHSTPAIAKKPSLAAGQPQPLQPSQHHCGVTLPEQSSLASRHPCPYHSRHCS
jgi:hypothetical protein